jgi:glycosyltransferase involved in cell wall biosynthesis
MKILFLSRLYLPHVGGVEKHVQQISRILSARHEIKIITEKHDPGLKDIEKIEGIEVHRMPQGGKKEIWKWMKKHKHLLDWADVIHVHDVYFWILPYRLRNWSKKTFITFHGYEGSEAPKIKQIIWHKIGEWLTRGNLCIGGFHQEWYKVKPTFTSYGAA